MIHPVWVGDFGKQNMSASSNLSAEAQVRLHARMHLYSAVFTFSSSSYNQTTTAASLTDMLQ
jgi:hypothetical protein